jgi:hypothetical protein
MTSIVHINNGNTNVFRSIAKAEALADTLRTDDPDARYVVIPNPTGADTAIIAYYDEDGVFVSYL